MSSSGDGDRVGEPVPVDWGGATAGCSAGGHGGAGLVGLAAGVGAIGLRARGLGAGAGIHGGVRCAGRGATLGGVFSVKPQPNTLSCNKLTSSDILGACAGVALLREIRANS